MAAEDTATQAARVSVAMVLTHWPLDLNEILGT